MPSMGGMPAIRRFLVVGVIAVLLGGCAQQPISPVDNVERYQRRLTAIKDWELRGKMNLRAPGHSETLRISWRNTAGDYAIRLSGALGMGATWVRGNAQGVRLERSGEETLFAASPEALVYRHLGWQVPISELRYWVRGLPAPTPRPRHVQFSSEGMLSYLEQSGWSLQYRDYRAAGPWRLPGKIVATRDDFRLTLVVSEWSLDASNP
jgi:outer membrane lipoprotein LolB